MDEPAKPLRILRDRETSAKTGIPRASRYEMMAAGEFPKGIPLGGGRVGWLEHELDEWILERVRKSRAAIAAPTAAELPARKRRGRPRKAAPENVARGASFEGVPT